MLRGRATGLMDAGRRPADDGRRSSAGRRGACARFDLAGLSLARRYLLLSLVFVVIGGGVVAFALGQLIETSAINRTTSVTALYVESFVVPELQSLATSPSLTQPEIESLQRLLNDSPLGQRVVSFRIWSTDGQVLYSPFPELIGRHFDMSGERGASARGAVIGDISDLSDPENVYERQQLEPPDRDLPAGPRQTARSRIIAVAEFYQLPDELEAEVNRDRLIALGPGRRRDASSPTWPSSASFARAARRSFARRASSAGGSTSSRSCSTRTPGCSDRIRHAAARTTALTELERRRIGSDLHDGPSQTPRLRDAPARRRRGPSRCRRPGRRRRPGGSPRRAAGGPDRHADHRGRPSNPRARAGRAGRDRPASRRRARAPGRDACDRRRRRASRPHAPLATKIALYRILSEALSNAARHGGGVGIAVQATESDGVPGSSR